MWDDNPWAKWGVTHTTRDGAPMLTETGLWYLMQNHPDAVETVSDNELWVYLDQPYHARRYPNRAYYLLTADPFHKRVA
jgi:hypothetical protein